MTSRTIVLAGPAAGSDLDASINVANLQDSTLANSRKDSNLWSRRGFVVGAASVAGGGLALGLWGEGEAAAQAPAAGVEVNVWVVVKPDDHCVVRIVRSEMGQGTRTGLAQLVAEELECDWAKISTEEPTPGQSLERKRAWGEFSTGGSRGIRISHDYVRRGAASARIMLMQAAAQALGVPMDQLAVSKGVISHAASGRSLRYGQVAEAAAKLTPPNPQSIQLKDPRTWKVAGQPMKRLDTAGKLDGSLKYAADLHLEGMLCAAIKDCPVYGGKLLSFDADKVKGFRGVRHVLRVNASTVAVVADTWWRAKKALDALPIVWDEGINATVSSQTIAAHLRSGLDEKGPLGSYAGRVEGDARAALARANKVVTAEYGTPFLSHATMEPMNCTVRLRPQRAEAWVPTQNGEASHAALAEAAGLPLAQCEIYKTDLGGGFGRRGGTQDYLHQAVAIARQLPAGTPLKLMWSREEDQAHDFYRPISQCRLSAGIDAQGQLTGLEIRLSGQSINAWLAPANIRDGKDERQVQGWWRTLAGDAQMGYTVPNLLIEYAMRNTHVPVGPWRGVNTNQNGFYMECFMDEVAKAAGRDPLAFRRSLMSQHPKHLGVLNAAAEKAGWGSPLPAGVYRGIAQFMGYASYSAAVAEVSVSADGKVKVHRLVFALNCGHAVNPDQIAAQVEGSVVYGLSATFLGEMSVEAGRMKELNFDTYPLMRIAHMPKVETVIVPTYDFWGGVGEPTICVVGPAVVNAIAAATGKPIRQLPLRKQGITFA